MDVLINNAGIAIAGPVEYIGIKKLKEQFDVNTFGSISVAQKFIPLLRGGRIINISSMAASGIFPFISPYCASKRAMDILFNGFELENKDNIKVISVKPASIKTPIWNKSMGNAKKYFETLNETAKEKYYKELLFMEKRALSNNDNGIEIYKAVDELLKIVYAKNPKPVYNIGSNAVLADMVSKFLPVRILNKIIKTKLSKI